MDLLSDVSSHIVIGKLLRLFATHGLPEKLLTDNGRQYVRSKFELFSRDWNFAHITISPYYPKSNGLAEKRCQTGQAASGESKEKSLY